MVRTIRALAVALVLTLVSFLNVSNVSAQERTPEYSGTVYVIVDSTTCYNPSPEGFTVWEELSHGTEVPVFATQPWDGYLMVDVDPGNGESCLVDPSTVSSQYPQAGGDEEATPVTDPVAVEPALVDEVPVSSSFDTADTVIVTGLPSTGSGDSFSVNSGDLWFVVGVIAFALAIPGIVLLALVTRACAVRYDDNRKAYNRKAVRALQVTGAVIWLVLIAFVGKPLHGIFKLIAWVCKRIGILLLDICLICVDRIPDKRPKRPSRPHQAATLN